MIANGGDKKAGVSDRKKNLLDLKNNPCSREVPPTWNKTLLTLQDQSRITQNKSQRQEEEGGSQLEFHEKVGICLCHDTSLNLTSV